MVPEQEQRAALETVPALAGHGGTGEPPPVEEAPQEIDHKEFKTKVQIQIRNLELIRNESTSQNKTDETGRKLGGRGHPSQVTESTSGSSPSLITLKNTFLCYQSKLQHTGRLALVDSRHRRDMQRGCTEHPPIPNRFGVFGHQQLVSTIVVTGIGIVDRCCTSCSRNRPTNHPSKPTPQFNTSGNLREEIRNKKLQKHDDFVSAACLSACLFYSATQQRTIHHITTFQATTLFTTLYQTTPCYRKETHRRKRTQVHDDAREHTQAIQMASPKQPCKRERRKEEVIHPFPSPSPQGRGRSAQKRADSRGPWTVDPTLGSVRASMSPSVQQGCVQALKDRGFQCATPQRKSRRASLHSTV